MKKKLVELYLVGLFFIGLVTGLMVFGVHYRGKERTVNTYIVRPTDYAADQKVSHL